MAVKSIQMRKTVTGRRPHVKVNRLSRRGQWTSELRSICPDAA